MMTYEAMKPELDRMLEQPADALRGALKGEPVTARALTRTVAEETVKRFGEGAAASLPMPDVINGRRVERFFLYRRVAGKPTGPRPFAIVTADAESGQLLAYQDVGLLDAATLPGEDRISHALTDGMTLSQYRQALDETYDLYETVRAFAFTGSLTPDQTHALADFSARFQTVTPAGHRDWYRVIGGRFLEWMGL